MDIQHIAKLARLEISAGDTNKWQSEMEEMIKMAGELPECSTADMLPDSIMPLRDDVIKDCGISHDEILKNAPVTRDGHICVPKTVPVKEKN